MTSDELKSIYPEWFEAYRRHASFLFHQWLEGYPEDLILLVAAACRAAAADNDAARDNAQPALRDCLPPEMYERGDPPR